MSDVVVVTGGGAGIGLALTQRLVAEGYRVATCGRDAARLAALLSEQPAVIGRTTDLSDPAAVEAFADFCLAAGRVVGLVNNAGVQHTGRLEPQSRQDIDAEIRTNLTAPAILAARLLPMLSANRGFLINVTSGLALAPKADAAVYCATKAGLRHLTLALRYQAPDVHVMEAMMPLVDTGMTAGRGRGKITPDVAAEQTLAALRARRTEAYVGRTAMLRVIDRLSPQLARRIMRG